MTPWILLLTLYLVSVRSLETIDDESSSSLSTNSNALPLNFEKGEEEEKKAESVEENSSIHDDEAEDDEVAVIDNLTQEVLEDEAALEKLEVSSLNPETEFSLSDLFPIISTKERVPSFRRIVESDTKGTEFEETFARQGFVSTSPEDGVRCIPKVVQVEETVYDRGMKCNHSFQEKCHMTFITDYKSTTQKKCDTSFKKNCHITFKPTTYDEKVKICHIPLVRQCGNTTMGPPICSTEYEDVCETFFKTYDIEQDHPECKMENIVRCQNVTHESPFGAIVPNTEVSSIIKETCEEWPVQKCTLEKKQVKKVHPETSCRKIPRKVCIPNNCNLERGDEICKDEKRIQVQNIPEEECDLQPEEQCHLESALVPRLIPKPNCIKVPKEICVNTKKNPRRVKKPVIKEWCYNPSDLNNQK